MSEPIERAPYPEHPNRCQTTNTRGQCHNLGAMQPDGKRLKTCLPHGGKLKSTKRNYNLTKWRARLDAKADAVGIKSLREEIGILRIMLEERLERAQDPMDLILQSGPISELVMKIERVVTSCHKLEGSMGQLLDKQALLAFATSVIGIITECVEDETVRQSIAERIEGLLDG